MIVSKFKNYINLESGVKAGKYFDFSTAIQGDLFGYRSMVASHQIKKNIKLLGKEYLGSGFDFLKSQLSLLYKHSPELESFEPLMLADADFYFFLSQVSSTPQTLEFESPFDLPIKKEGLNQNQENQVTLLSDLYYFYKINVEINKARNNVVNPEGRAKVILVKNCFPNFNKIVEDQTVQALIIAPPHPLGLAGYRLVFIRKNKENELLSSLMGKNKVSLFHLKLYQILISNYYFRYEKKHRLLRKAIDQGLQHNRLKVINKIDDFNFQIVLCESYLEKAEQHSLLPNRLFTNNTTIVFDRDEKEAPGRVVGYCAFPITTEINHLKNKWKDFRIS